MFLDSFGRNAFAFRERTLTIRTSHDANIVCGCTLASTSFLPDTNSMTSLLPPTSTNSVNSRGTISFCNFPFAAVNQPEGFFACISVHPPTSPLRDASDTIFCMTKALSNFLCLRKRKSDAEHIVKANVYCQIIFAFCEVLVVKVLGLNAKTFSQNSPECTLLSLAQSFRISPFLISSCLKIAFNESSHSPNTPSASQ